jgi:hypothetical protein
LRKIKLENRKNICKSRKNQYFLPYQTAISSLLNEHLLSDSKFKILERFQQILKPEPNLPRIQNFRFLLILVFVQNFPSPALNNRTEILSSCKKGHTQKLIPILQMWKVKERKQNSQTNGKFV